MNRTLVLVLLCTATIARGDVWQRAIARGPLNASNERYAAELQAGDDEVSQARSRSVSQQQVKAHVDAAEAAYRRAAAARPDQAEPYFRIATVLENFYVDCSPQTAFILGLWRSPLCGLSNDTLIKATLDAWDEFEKRAPLDPRVSDGLFSRAIMRTKLVTVATSKPYLEGAMRDYKAIVDRADGLTLPMERVWGNLAETYMMLGRLDDAIDAYGEAIRLGPQGSSTHYGLAVALDRDERGTVALDVIRGQGLEGFRLFREEFAQSRVFYVPEGEQFYYFALINEAFGYIGESITNWRMFLRSGAHPKFQARAKIHLDALLSQQRAHPRPAPPVDRFDRLP